MQMRVRFVALVLWAVVVVYCGGRVQAAESPQRPNIDLIMADDKCQEA